MVMGLDNSNSKDTPATECMSQKNSNGNECNKGFNYASVLGMLLYLHGDTHTDISFAVNQCAQYAFNPRRLHEEAMNHIGHYIKGTRTKEVRLH